MFGVELSELDIRDIQLMQSKVIREQGIDKNRTCRFATLFTFKYNYKKVDLHETLDSLSYIKDPIKLKEELRIIATKKEIQRSKFKKNVKLLRKDIGILRIYS
ncbi:MAG: hypothetical protein WC346_03925 [Methanogenium sp.]